MKSGLSTLILTSVVAVYSLSMLPIEQVTAQDDRRGIYVQQSSPTEKRIALILGNSIYKDAPLINPVNDARDMAVALRRLGFDVIYGENLSQKDMERYIRHFGSKIRDGGVGLFYYAGHGIQINGTNYLIPVNANITIEEEVKYESVDVGLVLAQMENARNSVNIVILDACRNNPFARSFRSATKGLASIDAPGGTLIAYATGSIASDGAGRNGLYTQELLKYIQTPELSIEQVFKQVRIAVRGKTGAKQTPWESSSLVGDFYFLEKNPTETPISPAPANKSIDPFGTWEMIVNTSLDDLKCQLTIERRGSNIIGIFTSNAGAKEELKGRLVANRLQLTTSIPLGRDKVDLTITGYIEGDTMKGMSELPALRSFNFVAYRIR